MPRGFTERFFQRVGRSIRNAVVFGPVYHDLRALHSDSFDLAGNYYFGEGSAGFSRYAGLADAILAMLPGDPPLTWRLDDPYLHPECLRAAAYKVGYKNGLKLHVRISSRVRREIVITRKES